MRIRVQVKSEPTNRTFILANLIGLQNPTSPQKREKLARLLVEGEMPVGMVEPAINCWLTIVKRFPELADEVYEERSAYSLYAFMQGFCAGTVSNTTFN